MSRPAPIYARMAAARVRAAFRAIVRPLIVAWPSIACQEALEIGLDRKRGLRRRARADRRRYRPGSESAGREKPPSSYMSDVGGPQLGAQRQNEIGLPFSRARTLPRRRARGNIEMRAPP
jgi:hypothetical protein